jgi:alpha-tubulin suppressor-like RCC1 family protein
VTAVWEESPLKIRPVDLGLPDGVLFTSAATGRAHTLLVASDGSVWSAGLNSSGQVCIPYLDPSKVEITDNLIQCGHVPCPEVSPFRAIDGEWRAGGDKVIQASAGNNFSLVLTATGKGWWSSFIFDLISEWHSVVYAFGSGEKGQLGNGRTGEHIITSGRAIFDTEHEPRTYTLHSTSRLYSNA